MPSAGRSPAQATCWVRLPPARDSVPGRPPAPPRADPLFQSPRPTPRNKRDRRQAGASRGRGVAPCCPLPPPRLPGQQLGRRGGQETRGREEGGEGRRDGQGGPRERREEGQRWGCKGTPPLPFWGRASCRGNVEMDEGHRRPVPCPGPGDPGLRPHQHHLPPPLRRDLCPLSASPGRLVAPARVGRAWTFPPRGRSRTRPFV